jgi:hypothetical protein
MKVVILALCLLAFLFTFSTRTFAVDFTVNLTTDQHDASVADNICDIDLATAGSQCTCTTGGPICEGSFFGNLSINGVNVAITGQPNQRVNLPVRGFITINEQIITGGGVFQQIKAKGLSIFVPREANADISLADSKIVCSPQ